MVKSLEYQRNIMALVMLAIQTIAIFVVYAVFSTLVAEKRHDIGVLLGIGARPAQIAGFAFIIAGLAACLFGGLLGWGIGWAVMWGLRVLSHRYGILLFPQDVFYSPDTPISWDPRILLVFIGAMALIGLVAVAIPALRAARIQPGDILREGGGWSATPVICGRDCSRAGSPAATLAWRSCAAPTSRSRPARWWPSAAPREPARAPCCTAWACSTAPTAARSCSMGWI